MSDASVRFETLPTASSHAIGVITLDVPATLNSLSLEMIDLLAERLRAWRDDASIAAVFVQGAGDRAFCAGGDIQALYRSMREAPTGPNEYAMAFFSREYRLNYMIHNYPKPMLAWGHGIVMGGGLGILGACSHRVGTETTRIALPEITIGLFPDAGATVYLARMESTLAHYMALTGTQLNAADSVRAHLIDHLVPNDAREGALEAMEATVWTGNADDASLLTQILMSLEDSSGFPPGKLAAQWPTLEAVFGASAGERAALAEVVSRIALVDDEHAWLAKAGDALTGGCPVTAHLIIEQIERARTLSIADMFRQELCLAMQCATHPDFAEGVRALLIDKDRQPKWVYPTIADVPREYVLAHFEGPWDGEHPLADLG